MSVACLLYVRQLVYRNKGPWTWGAYWGRDTVSNKHKIFLKRWPILEGDQSCGLKEKIGKDRGGGSRESRRCRVGVPLIENRPRRRWELHRLLTALLHIQTCQSTSQLVFLLGSSSLGPPFLFHLEPVVLGLPLFLCDIEYCFLFPGHGLSLFTPHSGNKLFPLSEKVSRSWTFSASPVTESLRTEFRGKILSPLEFNGHDIIDFHLLWLPKSLLLFWLLLPPPFWKPWGLFFIPGWLMYFISLYYIFIHLLSPYGPFRCSGRKILILFCFILYILAFWIPHILIHVLMFLCFLFKFHPFIFLFGEIFIILQISCSLLLIV